MKSINLYKPVCPLCGKRRHHIHAVSDTLQDVWTLLINLLKLSILLLLLILVGAALFK
jgi:hypothetical protein